MRGYEILRLVETLQRARLRIPMRGYELGQVFRDDGGHALRIPMRGYERVPWAVRSAGGSRYESP